MAYLLRLLLYICIFDYFNEIHSSLVTSIEVDEPYLRIKRKIKDSQGYKCTYYEDRGTGGKGPRTLVIRCSNNCGKKIECDYKGQPHNCLHWNLDFMMAEQLAQEKGGMCSKEEIEIKKCPGVVFKKQ